MSLWWARVFGVLLGMSIEVGFSASVVQLSEESDLISAPVGCEAQLLECAVRVRESRRKSLMIDGERRFVLGPSTNVFFNSPTSVRLLSGQLWIFANDELVRVQTPMGVFETQGEAWAQGALDDLQVLNLGGELRIQALGAKEEIALPDGMKNRLTGVNGARARIGIPQMASPAEVISSMAPLFWGTKNQFRLWIEEHSEIWVGLENHVADLHLKLAEREIASLNERLEHERAIARVKAEERRRLRKMFFDRTFDVQ